MSHLSMLKPSYTAVLTVTGLAPKEENDDEEALRDPETEAQIALLNHLLLQRYGMDMNGRLGIRSTRGRLAELYVQKVQGTTEEEKAREAVRKVDALIVSFNKALDKINFPNQARSQSR